MEELIGQTLGPYHIIEQIGEGGMATVFKAYQPSLDRYVAVKVLPPLFAKQPNFTQRFEREAKAVANLNHPNILPVYEAGQDSGYSFIGMRYVENAQTLKELMAHPLTLTQIADLISQIGNALGYAHQKGVLHRDVKPSNVLMDGNWALLSDFGLAKMTEETVQLTGTGVSVGTPAYMSPEQGKGQQVDHRTDIYSLGIILFEMLTHQIPHKAETPIATIIKRSTEPLPPLRRLNPNISESVERVVLKALARNPADRFDTAEKMVAALCQAIQESPNPHLLMIPSDDERTVASDSGREGTQPVPPAQSTAVSVLKATLAKQRWLTQHPRWLLAIAGIVLLALAAAGIILSQGLGQQTTPDKQAVVLPAATETATATQPVPISTATATMTTAPSDTPSPTNTPTSTPTPTPKPTSTPTNTATPTQTPLPTKTNTPAPTNTPRPTIPPTPAITFVQMDITGVCIPDSVPANSLIVFVLGYSSRAWTTAEQAAVGIGDSHPVFTANGQSALPASKGFGGVPLNEQGRTLEPSYDDQYGWGYNGFGQITLEPGVYEIVGEWTGKGDPFYCTLTVTE